MFSNRLNTLRLIACRSFINNRKNSLHFTLENVHPIRRELIEKLQIPEENANLILLKWLNEATIDQNYKQLNDKIELLKSNFTLEDIHNNIHVLNDSIDTVENRIQILNELALKNLEIKMLDSMPNLLAKTIKQLKEIGFYEPSLNLIDCLCDEFRQSITDADSFKQFENIIQNELKQITDDDSFQIQQIRLKLIEIIFKFIMNCSDQVIQHIIDNNSEQLKSISLNKLLKSLYMLKNQLNLPVNYMIKNLPTLIKCDVENLEKLSSIKYLRENFDLRNSFFTHKRLLAINANLIEKRIGLIIEKYKCTPAQLSRHIFILELNEDNIRKNFEKFAKQIELQCYRNDRDFLRLILNIDLAIKNIRILNDSQQLISSRFISINNLLKSTSRFSNMIENNNFKLTLNTFVQMHFGISMKDVRQKIGKYHPKRRKSTAFNSINAENVLKFLREEKHLTDEQIINGIYLIYYDFSTIQMYWPRLLKQIEQHSNIDWLRHVNVLQLLFHLIETSSSSTITEI